MAKLKTEHPCTSYDPGPIRSAGPLFDADAIDSRHPGDFIDGAHDNDGPSQRELLAEAVRGIIEFLLAGIGDKGGNVRLRTLALHLGVPMADIDSYSDIAKASNSTRSAVQYTGKRIESEFGLRWCGARTDTTRDKAALSAYRQHDARRKAHG
jgi:hypothetical protein